MYLENGNCRALIPFLKGLANRSCTVWGNKEGILWLASCFLGCFCMLPEVCSGSLHFTVPS